MLKINPAPTFEFDAQITVPGAEQLATVRITARHKSRDGLQVWIDSAKGSTGDVEFLGGVIAGWSGVLSDTGDELPYSPDALGKMLQGYPAAGHELFTQYLAALTESRRKN